MAPRTDLLKAVSPQQLAACHEIARWLYCPEEVWPYLRQELRPDPARAAGERLLDLVRWVQRRAERVEDGAPLCQPDRWRSPGEALWHGAATSAELALLLWSAAPLMGLPPGRLVIGACGGRQRAWVEWPELGLFVDAGLTPCGAPGSRPAGYTAQLTIWPPLSIERSTDRHAA